MDFSFSEDQIALRELARRIFSDRSDDERLLELSRSGLTYDEQLWSTLAEHGLLGTAVPESCGGTDLGLTELCLLLEEQGRSVAPVPLFSSLVLGGMPIRHFGSEAQHRRWLTPLAAGKLRISAAIAELGMPDAMTAPVFAEALAGAWRLSGTRSVVPDGATADLLLVPALDRDGNLTMFVVDCKAEGVSLDALEIGLSGSRAANLRLDAVRVMQDAVLGQVGQGLEILEWLEQRADIGHCALQLGVTEESMRRTAAYVSERKQFGVPVGSFQALAMRMADCYIDVECIRSTYWLARWRLSNGHDARPEVHAAKWWTCRAAHRVVSTAQHLHGGLGADVTYPIHRFFLMAKLISYSLGNAGKQLKQLGQLFADNDSYGFHALEVE